MKHRLAFALVLCLSATLATHDRYSDIKSEQLIIYNQQKYPMSLTEFNKNILAYESLKYAIKRFNENAHRSYYRLNRLLNAYKQPFDDEIYTFNVSLLRIECHGDITESEGCEISKPNRLVNCSMKISVKSWKKKYNERFKIYQIKC
jgi:hypothetical protein